MDFDSIPAHLIMENKKHDITLADIKKVHKKAYLESLQQFFKTAYLREHVRQFAENGTLPYTPEDPKLEQLLINQADTIATKPVHLLVTINPRQDVTLDVLIKYVNKYIKKKTITHYIYCYEVRNDKGGLHCHILLKYADKPYNFKRGTKNTFKHICDSNNPNILNFKFVSDENLQQKVDYILGQKKDSKKKGVEESVKYRTQNNLLPVYESSPPLPCRATQKIEDLSSKPPLEKPYSELTMDDMFFDVSDGEDAPEVLD